MSFSLLSSVLFAVLLPLIPKQSLHPTIPSLSALQPTIPSLSARHPAIPSCQPTSPPSVFVSPPAHQPVNEPPSHNPVTILPHAALNKTLAISSDFPQETFVGSSPRERPQIISYRPRGTSETSKPNPRINILNFLPVKIIYLQL